MPILGACLMPNHIHLVVRPTSDNDISVQDSVAEFDRARREQWETLSEACAASCSERAQKETPVSSVPSSGSLELSLHVSTLDDRARPFC